MKREHPSGLKTKPLSLLTLAELDQGAMDAILSLSLRLKVARGASKTQPLQGKTVALLFEKPSTRTRVSFQVAVSELGGSSISLSSNEIQLGRGETVEDTARVLSRYVHAIMARVNAHPEVEHLATSSTVPVINGLSDLYHPVQILADLLTLKERRGHLKGLKVAWVGDGNNVCNSWLIGAATTGINFTAATPQGYGPHYEAVRIAKAIAKGTGASLNLIEDPKIAVAGADCVIADTFVSMGFDKERAERVRVFLPKYRVDRRLMALAKRDAIFEHCLPAHRGEEVTDEVIDGRNSAVWDEAENRLHTTKALLCYLLLRRSELQKLP